MRILRVVAGYAALALFPLALGAAESNPLPSDPSSWGSYQGIRVPPGGESLISRSYLPSAPKSSFSVDAASATNEGGIVRFHYSPSFRESAKDSSLRAGGYPSKAGRSGFSFYGQLGDPRYGNTAIDGREALLPSDRPGGFILDPQRDFRRYSGFSFGVGYDF